MTKNYLKAIVCSIWLLGIALGHSQDPDSKSLSLSNIEGLMLYPNPVSNGKLYISSSKNQVKAIEIFNVLGKKVHSLTLIGNFLDVSSFNSGVYIIKITENNRTANRKLIIK